LKARFDEQANIFWTNRLEEEGVSVNYGILDYKVHSKICLVKRQERGKYVFYANLATGNFNEKTAGLYCDHSLFTANPQITSELVKLFKGLQTQTFFKGYKYLIVSPLESRSKLNELINHEIKNAKSGKLAYITLKMNSLTDEEVISKLYDANNAGVKIKLIIRGMCSLIPGVTGFSENIEVFSIIDRFLEHARVWIFANSGVEKVYLTSADLMARNLDNRVEVGFPILDQEVKSEILKIIDIQLMDNSKAREINQLNNNRYRKTGTKVLSRAQTDIYTYLKYKK
jgi:polyphosphate kinase